MGIALATYMAGSLARSDRSAPVVALTLCSVPTATRSRRVDCRVTRRNERPAPLPSAVIRRGAGRGRETRRIRLTQINVRLRRSVNGGGRVAAALPCRGCFAVKPNRKTGANQ